MRALVSLPENCGSNLGWADWSWYTDTQDPGLLSVFFFIYHELFPYVLHLFLLVFPNIYDAQRCTSSFKSINIDGRTTHFSSLSMDLG